MISSQSSQALNGRGSISKPRPPSTRQTITQTGTNGQEGVQNLFGRVFGDETLPETVSGGSVTDSNMMTFLGMIEEKTNSLLQVCMHVKRCKLCEYLLRNKR